MIQIFGIRHHGPGCARSLVTALDEWQPDVVVIEAPADLEPIFSHAADADMQPPVAMLVYPRDQPSRSVVYPMAVFSPEWQALQWGLRNGRPVHAMDLPMSIQMAMEISPGSTTTTSENEPQNSAETIGETTAGKTWRIDPLAVLAETAGYSDHELWWEEQIERRHDSSGVFVAILEVMQAIRAEFPESSPRDLLREAYMRKTLRSLAKQGQDRKIAVVCGAWHGPVLTEEALAGKLPGYRIQEDNQRLKGLGKLKTVATWIPWTYSRLAYRSGYGAGITSPGWYAHLWECPTSAPTRWIVNAAQLLRKRDLSASSASVIEACRLADALAALRELRGPGLQELNEAILTVLCQGETGPLALIRQELEVGDRLGSVPGKISSVPLAEDVARQQKSLRMKPSTRPRTYDLDLRSDHARAQSRLLHRLRILNIHWGVPQPSGNRWSTFHEIWSVKWEPEFAISLIEANVWGNTLEAASAARLQHQSRNADTLAALPPLLSQALDADLLGLVPELIDQIQAVFATTSDVLPMMQSFPELATIVRYGNVRGTGTDAIEPILESMLTRICISLPVACAGVDDDMAQQLTEGLSHLQRGLETLQREDLLDPFHERVRSLAESDLHGLIRGWSVRYLLEKGLVDAGVLERLASLALSSGNEISQAAAWLTGLLSGSGLQLIHQETLWRVMDNWLIDLPEEGFVNVLPILRRGFSAFSHAERRQMGELIKSFHQASVGVESAVLPGGTSLNETRADLVLPILARILGVNETHE